ncbi:MAG: hypothetical protein KME15_25280 [Drouetiella hepatica Uher 2000/2452]|uniref:Uncharacterized protein n=1 Tax=Drouetiella hepatica Uher 2000/2452 TaxID=904376 RepID=A0A951UPX6_9CYAN|nr:hypothetical protein [Drouetiella hepatica Uher 2000/2452]
MGKNSSDALKIPSGLTPSPKNSLDRPVPGSSVAALWLQISQDNQPPASVPVKHLPQHCPQCHHPLNLLTEDFERQACAKCGWSEPLRSPQVQDAGMLAELELKQLLEQAALESLNNMKTRRDSSS